MAGLIEILINDTRGDNYAAFYYFPASVIAGDIIIARVVISGPLKSPQLFQFHESKNSLLQAISRFRPRRGEKSK